MSQIPAQNSYIINIYAYVCYLHRTDVRAQIKSIEPLFVPATLLHEDLTYFIIFHRHNNFTRKAVLFSHLTEEETKAQKI